jgi:tetratricopeptide (TPR) repeat protein
VADDRNVLEQRAMSLLQKGKTGDALQAYLTILKSAPRDIRLRSKIADLYLKVGKKPEAMRQLREVALGHIAEDQTRPAIVVLKQLIGLKPKDDEATGLLGDCYKKTGFPRDAREWFEKTIELLEDRPKEALPWAEKLMSVAPGEMPPKVGYAELLNRAGKFDIALGRWQALGREARRRGNAADQALFNERALRIDDTLLESLELAAEARISMGQPKEALVHIQKAYGANPDSDGLLSMLAQCFELLEQPKKAKKVLLQLAKLVSERNDPVARHSALERALACDPEDAELKSSIGDAVARAQRCQMKLTDKAWASPQSTEEAEVVVRAATMLRYGFGDRAKDVLQGVDAEMSAKPSVQALLVEVFAVLDDLDEAHALIVALQECSSGNDEVLADLMIRGAVLRGDFEPQAGESDASGASDEVGLTVEDDEEEVVELEMEDESVVELEMEDESANEPTVDDGSGESESAQQRGDALLGAGDRDGAMAAYRSGLAEDPTDENLLMKIGELFNEEKTSPPVELPPESLQPLEGLDEDEDDQPAPGLPDFLGIFDGASGSAEADAIQTPKVVERREDAVLSEARGRLLLGTPGDVAEILEGRDDLGAMVLIAEAMMVQEDLRGAMRCLRDAMDEADDDDGAYVEALWRLAVLQARMDKQRAAEKTIGKLEGRDSAYLSLEIDALRRAIAFAAGE